MANDDPPTEDPGALQDGNGATFSFVEDVNSSEADNMDIDTSSPNSDIEPTHPLFFSRLTTTGPSSPPPNLPLPPNPPTRHTQNQNQDQNNPQYHPAPDPFKKPLTINLHHDRTGVPDIINTPASSPSPTVLTHPRQKRDQEPGALGIPKGGVKEGVKDVERRDGEEKVVPSYLKSAFRKYPRKFTSNEKKELESGTEGGEDLVVQPLRICKEADVTGKKVEGKGNPITEQAIHDLDALLGLTSQKSKFEGYISPQEPLVVGMASVPGQSPGKGYPLSGDDEDGDEDDGLSSVSGAAGMGRDITAAAVKTKKKRFRKRKPKSTGSGTTTPGREPAGMPSVSAFPSVTSASPIPAAGVEELATHSAPSAPAPGADEPFTRPAQTEQRWHLGTDTGTGTDAGAGTSTWDVEEPTPGADSREGTSSHLPSPPSSPTIRSTSTIPSSPTPSTTSQTPTHSSPSASATLPKPQPKSPFVPAVPTKNRLPPIREAERAPTMICHPDGVDAPRREFDWVRVKRERADIEALVMGKRPGSSGDEDAGREGGGENGGDWSGGDVAYGGLGMGTVVAFAMPNVGEDAGAGAGVQSLTRGIAPRRDVFIPPEVLSFRSYASLPQNTTNADIQRGLSAVEAALLTANFPSQRNTEEILRLRALIQSMERTINTNLDELARTRKELAEVEDVKGVQRGLLEIERRKTREAEEMAGKLRRELELGAGNGNAFTYAAGSGSEAELDAVVVKLGNAEKEIEALKKEYDESNLITRADCQKLSDEKDRAHEQRIEDLQADVKILQAKLDAASGPGITEDAAGEKSAEKIKDLEDKVAELEYALSTVEADEPPSGMISLEECTAQNAATNSKLEKEIERLKGEIKRLAKGTASSMTAAGEEKTRREKELQGEIDNLKKENETLAAKAESTTREAADVDLKNEVQRLEEEVKEANHNAQISDNSAKIITNLLSQRSTEKAALEKRIAEFEKSNKETKAADPNSISIADCESQKAALNKKLEDEMKALQAQIANLKAKLKPFEDGDTISRKDCDDEKSRERNIFRDQAGTLQKMVQEADDRAKPLEERIKQLERENKLLRDSVDTLRSDLQDCRDSKNAAAKKGTLKERIAGLGRRVTEINKLVDSQGAELRKRGISSKSSQLRMFEEQNARLIEDKLRLEEELRTARNRKVASPYTSLDEKDAKIEELAQKLQWVSESSQYHFIEAHNINNEYGRLWREKQKLEDRLKEMEEEVNEAKEKGKKSSPKKPKKDKTNKKKTDSYTAARADASETGQEATTVIDAEKLADIQRKEAEIRRYETLVRERDVVESQVGKPNGEETAAIFTKQVLQWMIRRVEQCLANMVASRALNGMQKGDALAAVCAADDAMYKAEQVGDADLSAQAFLWAGIANFYHGQSQVAQGYLDRADELKKYLKSDADRKVLGLWIKHGVENKPVEKRMEGYKRFLLGRRRTSSSGTTSAMSLSKPKLTGTKPTNTMNDIPEFDPDEWDSGENEVEEAIGA